MNINEDLIKSAAVLIINARRRIAFTGAGISVESGIPPFRGQGGLWNKYDPKFLDINYFHDYPDKSWDVIYKIFYEFFSNAKPNKAHVALAEMEKMGFLQGVITQNIDNLHQQAGTRVIHEFHGNSTQLICKHCGQKYPVNKEILKKIPPRCNNCDSILKPDFIFFGESIPEPAMSDSFAEATKADLFILIGTTGEVQPAAMIPFTAKRNNAKIIEVNTVPSNYTGEITDIFLQGQAGEIMEKLLNYLKEITS